MYNTRVGIPQTAAAYPPVGPLIALRLCAHCRASLDRAPSMHAHIAARKVRLCAPCWRKLMMNDWPLVDR